MNSTEITELLEQHLRFEITFSRNGSDENEMEKGVLIGFRRKSGEGWNVYWNTELVELPEYDFTQLEHVRDYVLSKMNEKWDSIDIDNYHLSDIKIQVLVDRIIERVESEHYLDINTEFLKRLLEQKFWWEDDYESLIVHLAESLQEDPRVEFWDNISLILDGTEYQFTLLPAGRYESVREAKEWAHRLSQLIGRKDIIEYTKIPDSDLSQIISRSKKKRVLNPFPKPVTRYGGCPVWLKREVNKWFSRYVEGWYVKEKVKNIRDAFVDQADREFLMYINDETLIESVRLEWNDGYMTGVTEFHEKVAKKVQEMLKEDPRIKWWYEGEEYITESGERKTVDTPVITFKEHNMNPHDAYQKFRDSF